MKPKYDIGDKVWYVETDSQPVSEVCPECAGKLFLTVILGGGEQVNIDCETCTKGGFGTKPTGYVENRIWKARLIETTVEGMDVMPGRIEYKFNVRGSGGCYSCKSREEADVFDSKEDGEKRLVEAEAEMQAEEVARLRRKEKPHQKWSWNVSYYRRQIRHLEKDLAFYRAKLDAAPKKVLDNANDL